MERENKSLAIKLLLPLLIAVFCGSIIFLLSIRPYEKIKTYLQIGFMDNNTVIPESNGIAGLNIVQTDIDTKYSGQVSEKGEIVYPEYGTQYAVIECESADIYAPVYWGGGADLLALGACNTPSSVVAGGEGNTVISAHVNTFFRDLSKVIIGDTVTLYTDYGRFTYKAVEQIEFHSTDKSYIRKKDDNRLTLYTCEQDLLAESSKRICVVCCLEKSEFYVKGNNQ